jgi:GTP pyrophosphokinase
LPVGATPVDFAYAIHSDIGDHCVGVKVNRKIQPLDYQLQSGETVEILVRKNISPNKDWLEFVKTPLARQKIRKYFRQRSAG